MTRIAEVEQVEQERQRGRERGDDEDDGDDEQFELADHLPCPSAVFARSGRLAGGGRRRRGGRRRTQLARSAAGRPDALDRRRLEQLAHDLGGLDVVDRRARLDDQAVGQGRLGERLDVVGDDVVATEQAGQRLPRPIQRDRAARRCAEVDVGVVPRPVDQPDDVVATPSSRRRSRGRPPASRAGRRRSAPLRARRADASASARRG